MALEQFIKELKVKVTFIDEALGMMPADPNIHEQYIASKSPDAATIEEEVAAVGVDEVVEKGITIFPKLIDGTPFFWDYQMRGYIKDSIGILRRVSGTECSKVKAFKKIVDGQILIKERKIPIHVAGEMGDCQRPLRAETAQGARVAIAHSETVPAGSWFECTFQILGGNDLLKVVKECLDYGAFHGMGQWRNSGKGRLSWEEMVS